ncbi:MAG TPA: hypothetical protein VMY05_07645 [Acidobacteriota bacterium]|nr:hypothetical protein [Acidobacteriota bacterium]
MRTAVLIVLVATVTGCGGRQARLYNQPTPESGGHYEIAWTDPQLVAADTLFTLIRSEQIDSVYVARPDPFAHLSPSISFHVTEDSCTAAVNLVDDRSRVVLPLLVRSLGSGYYRLTFHYDQFNAVVHPSASYFLTANVCGRAAGRMPVGR